MYLPAILLHSWANFRGKGFCVLCGVSITVRRVLTLSSPQSTRHETHMYLGFGQALERVTGGLTFVMSFSRWRRRLRDILALCLYYFNNLQTPSRSSEYTQTNSFSVMNHPFVLLLTFLLYRAHNATTTFLVASVVLQKRCLSFFHHQQKHCYYGVGQYLTQGTSNCYVGEATV